MKFGNWSFTNQKEKKKKKRKEKEPADCGKVITPLTQVPGTRDWFYRIRLSEAHNIEVRQAILGDCIAK